MRLRVMWALLIGLPLAFFLTLAIVGSSIDCNVLSSGSNCYVWGIHSSTASQMRFFAPFILTIPAVVQIVVDNKYSEAAAGTRGAEKMSDASAAPSSRPRRRFPWWIYWLALALIVGFALWPYASILLAEYLVGTYGCSLDGSSVQLCMINGWTKA